MDTNTKKFEERYLINKNYYGKSPSTLFKKTKRLLKERFRINKKPSIKILEVGAGQARDSIALARLFPSSKIFCTDSSNSAIRTAKQNIQKAGLTHQITAAKQNVFEAYKEKYNNSDILFANMCLHYHRDTTIPAEFVDETLQVFKHAIQSLSHSGLFVFAVNSDKDEYFGKGEEIGKNSGVWKFDDRIRHFFTRKFIEETLENNECQMLFIAHISENYDPNIEREQQYYIVVAEKL